MDQEYFDFLFNDSIDNDLEHIPNKEIFNKTIEEITEIIMDPEKTFDKPIDTIDCVKLAFEIVVERLGIDR